MMSAKSFLKLYKSESRRTIWLPLVGIILVFFAFPMLLLRMIISYDESHSMVYQKALSYDIEKIQCTLQNFFTPGHFMYDGLISIMFVLAIVNGVTLFSHLFSKSKQDFYFSQPVKRSTWFLCYYLQGVVNLLLVYVVNLLIVLLILVVNNSLIDGLLAIIMKSFFVNMVGILSIYTTAVLASVLTGTILFAYLGTGVLLVVFPMIGSVVYTFPGTKISPVLNAIAHCQNISPLISWDNVMKQPINSDNGSVPYGKIPFSYSSLIIMALIILVTLILAYVSYCRRQTEETGQPVAVPVVKKIIKITFLLIYSFLAASFVPNFFRNQFSIALTFVGFAFGILSGLYVFDTILNLDWKAAFHQGKGQFIYILICSVTFFSFFCYYNQIRYKGFDQADKYKNGAVFDENKLTSDGYVILNSNKVFDDKIESFQKSVEKNEDAILKYAEISYHPGELKHIVYSNNKFLIYSWYGGSYLDFQRYKYMDKVRDKKENADYLVFSNKKITKEEIDYNNSYVICIKEGKQNINKEGMD